MKSLLFLIVSYAGRVSCWEPQRVRRLYLGGKGEHYAHFLRSRGIARLGAHCSRNGETSAVQASGNMVGTNHEEIYETPPSNARQTITSQTQDNQLEAGPPSGPMSAHNDNGPYLEQKPTAHGSHVMLDLTGFFVDATEGAALVLMVIRAAVARSEAREMHAKSVVLGDDGLSPPGFTSVVLIDESHVTAHCYSELGWLAIDCFTCGTNSKMPQVRVCSVCCKVGCFYLGE